MLHGDRWATTDAQAKWRDDAICARNRRRYRAARAAALYADVASPIPLASTATEAKEKDEWRYWQADLLLSGRDAEAKADPFLRFNAEARILSDGRGAAFRRRGCA